MKRWLATLCLVLAITAGCSPDNNIEENEGPLPNGNVTPNDLHNANTEIEALE